MTTAALRVWTLTVADVQTGRQARLLAGAIERLPGVESASVNIDTKNVTVRGRDLTRERVRRTVADAGFHAA